MKLAKILIIFMAAILLLAACKQEDDTVMLPDEPTPTVGQEEPIEREIFAFTQADFPRMDGSPSTVPLAQAVACALLGQSRDNVEELAIFTRTTQSFRNLAAGLCDILIVGEPAPGVYDELEEQGFKLDIAPIAVDALVFIVSASNPVDNLTSGQLRDIYTGVITNWQQVGGENVEITAFQRNEEAGSQVLMEKLVMDWLRMADAPMQSFAEYSGAGERLTAIKGFDGSAGAIGYTMYHYAEKMKMADGLKIISIDGVKPGTATITSGDYPFLNPYYVVIGEYEPEDNPARIMYNWLLSDEGQDFISREGYVSMHDSTLQDAEREPPPEMRWGVKTDISNLSGYTPPHSAFSRLHDASLPELVPSNHYGTLLPYSSAVTMNDGSLRLSKFGFVTQGGTVITDLIYDNVLGATYNTPTSNVPCPAYHLHIDIPDDPGSDISEKTLQAAVAPDGSWITPFEFAAVVFTDEVIFHLRDNETFDIDVYDYDGKMLYNILELDWADDISQDTWAGLLVYSVSDGYGFIRLSDDTYAMMDVRTGNIRQTELIGAFSFSEGLAAAVADDAGNLWGFVNKNLEFVIPPAYVNEAAFISGRAIVETRDGRQHIINKQGDQLFSVTSENMIVLNHDGIGFSVYPREDWLSPTFYTGDFEEIGYPADARLIGTESAMQYIGNGWYTCVAEDGTWLFDGDSEYVLPSSRYIREFVDGYIIFNEYIYDSAVTYFGVMKPDGQDVITSQEAASITPVMQNGVVSAFIINTSTTQGDFIRESYTPAIYRLVDTEGGSITAGPGMLSYNEVLELYYVQGTDHCAWMDTAGNIFITIPSMAYSFD